jgi:hypothetical protein
MTRNTTNKLRKACTLQVGEASLVTSPGRNYLAPKERSPVTITQASILSPSGTEQRSLAEPV